MLRLKGRNYKPYLPEYKMRMFIIWKMGGRGGHLIIEHKVKRALYSNLPDKLKCVRGGGRGHLIYRTILYSSKYSTVLLCDF